MKLKQILQRVSYTQIIVMTIVCTVICSIPWIVIIIVGSEMNKLDFPKTIYTDISSLDFLEKRSVEGLVPVDSELEDLEPNESYVATVKYRNCEYDVYAYVFSSIDEARAYYQNVTEIDDLMRAKGLYNLNFKGDIFSEYCAYYENCVFRVEGEKLSRLCKFMEWFGKDLPIDITEEFYKEFGVYPPI